MRSGPIRRDFSYYGLNGTISSDIHILTSYKNCKSHISYIHGEKYTFYTCMAREICLIIMIYLFVCSRDLSNNNLTGKVPEFLAKMKLLTVM